MTTVLTPEELIDLTGFKWPSKQIVWLKKNGFKYRLNRHGQPKVDRSHYEGKMGVGKASETTGPNWSALT